MKSNKTISNKKSGGSVESSKNCVKNLKYGGSGGSNSSYPIKLK